MKCFLLFSCCILLSVATYAQPNKQAPREYNEHCIKPILNKLDTLAVLVPKNLRSQTFLALWHYPELAQTSIELRYRNQKTTMSVRPKASFIFKKKFNRKYIISINKQLKRSGDGILVDSVPFNAQIGLIGHEMAHIVDYQNKSSVGILIMGVRYLFPSYRRKVELAIDRLTINHGLFYQLYDWSDYVFNLSDANEKYIRYKSKYYYTEKELLELIPK